MAKLSLGILGGGQLGSMLASAAKKIDIETVVFSDDLNAKSQVSFVLLDTIIFSDVE